MPELPEVQTVISDLNKKIKGDTVTSFWSDWPSAIKNSTLAKFKKTIIGRKILGARRIGKNIFVDLSGGKTLYLHLKMTGHLLIKEQNTKSKAQKYFDDRVNKYVHHAWQLGKNKKMEFSDMRKFAKIVLVDTKQVGELKEIKSLGIDALDPKLTLIKFQNILAKRPGRPIGLVLMDQAVISGIGNIYRSEILFEAKVDPRRLAGQLKPLEQRVVWQAMRKILNKAIKMRGTSDSDYRDTGGAPGRFQTVLRVYRKAGKKCPKCATMIKRLQMGQRSVFICSQCQR
ncbi:bifunctional DNA-formamidopyrimidine glycosylase/DNA-(apurinic or apyrimidinic site) lyase [Patescibacteria group bacterium]|nr:MAG: bifunctional DNA-formamidopyrimidine glycosylase/DNA-(apurinic or apyrimidinic site) lyase [Patescibacteria group bacterium]